MSETNNLINPPPPNEQSESKLDLVWMRSHPRVNLDYRLCGGGLIYIVCMYQILLVKPAPTTARRNEQLYLWGKL